ncbi:MAG TPA: metallophosphoesterase [Clostridiales bacterium]|nr:metallophosphoesterase [Clostridiales bacterium]
MAVYAISDLHLALGVDKPMDVFGGRWLNYMERLRHSWRETVTADDYVLIPGDISWATYLEEAYKDFKYIDDLPGEKIILKGNHDYWWTTLRKLDIFLKNNKLFSINFLHNNSYITDDLIICGTRGWKCPGDDDFSEDDSKIYTRELQRLQLSLESSAKINSNTAAAGERNIIVALHYMPFSSRREPSGFIDLMQKYNVKMCIYGHLHGEGAWKNAVNGEIEGITYRLVAADYLDFKPVRIQV